MEQLDKKANLFVVGAMKAGTTGFMDLLGQHANIYTSPVKEPHFFVDALPTTLYEPSRFFSLKEYLNTTFPEPLHITKIETSMQYEKIFSLAGLEKYRVDGSTAYLHCEETPKSIKQYHPKAKVIILLRDPIKRAFSHYMMNCGKGRENRSFNEAMAKDLLDYEENSLHWSSYLNMSFYDDQIANFKTHFDEVLILRFEDFVENRESVLKEVSSFLSVSEFDNAVVLQKNESRSLRFQKLFYFLKQLGLKDYFSRMFGTAFKQRLYKLVSKSKKSEMELSSNTEERLEQLFKERSGAWYY